MVVVRLNCVRRVSHLLDVKGIINLYAAQVRSVIEYATSCLGLLNKIQSNTQRLISRKGTPY